MSTWWKYLVALGLVVPIAAYVAGSLTASADSPRPRETIVIEDQAGDSGRPGRASDDAKRDKNDNGRVEEGDDESGPGDDTDDDGGDRDTDDGGSQRAAGTDDGSPAGGAGTPNDSQTRDPVPGDDSVDGDSAADSNSADT